MGDGPEVASGIPQPASGGSAPGPAGGDRRDGNDPLISALLERAAELDGDAPALLALLRAIEAAHRAIQDGPFRGSLPEDRNRLFELLADMERSGGWPYIPRLQLRTFLDLLQPEPEPGRPADQPQGEGPAADSGGHADPLAA